jgi:hypothetical protein
VKRRNPRLHKTAELLSNNRPTLEVPVQQGRNEFDVGLRRRLWNIGKQTDDSQACNGKAHG